MAGAHQINAQVMEAAAAAGVGGETDAADAILVVRAKADRGAFALLDRRYVDPVYRYCYRRLGSRRRPRTRRVCSSSERWRRCRGVGTRRSAAGSSPSPTT